MFQAHRSRRAYLPTALRGVQRWSAVHSRRSHPWVMIWTLAVAEVISWGTLMLWTILGTVLLSTLGFVMALSEASC